MIDGIQPISVRAQDTQTQALRVKLTTVERTGTIRRTDALAGVAPYRCAGMPAP
jgi:hypothetical protein